jgi:Flp pilus assembly protein TadG
MPIEIVLVLPILAVLLVVVLDGGRIALMQNAVARAAVDGA